MAEKDEIIVTGLVDDEENISGMESEIESTTDKETKRTRGKAGINYKNLNEGKAKGSESQDDEAKQETKKKEPTVAQLQAEKNKILSEKAKILLEKNKLKDEKSELSKKNAEISKKNTELTKRNQALEKELARVQEESKLRLDKIDEIRTENRSLQMKIEEMKEEMSVLHEQNNTTNQEKNALKKQLDMEREETDTLTERVVTLEERLEQPMEPKKKILAIMDSNGNRIIPELEAMTDKFEIQNLQGMYTLRNIEEYLKKQEGRKAIEESNMIVILNGTNQIKTGRESTEDIYHQMKKIVKMTEKKPTIILETPPSETAEVVTQKREYSTQSSKD